MRRVLSANLRNSRHIAGLARVLELRGPTQHVSGFEREILIASMGGGVSIAIL